MERNTKMTHILFGIKINIYHSTGKVNVWGKNMINNSSSRVEIVSWLVLAWLLLERAH